MLDDRAFSHTRIVASDNGWEIARDIQNDPALSAAVDYIGYVMTSKSWRMSVTVCLC